MKEHCFFCCFFLHQLHLFILFLTTCIASVTHISDLRLKKLFLLFGICKDTLPLIKSSSSAWCHIWTLTQQESELSSEWVAPPGISTNPTNSSWYLHVFAPPSLGAHPECRVCPQVTGVRKENEASPVWGYREIQDTWGHQVSPERAWRSSYAVFLR